MKTPEEATPNNKKKPYPCLTGLGPIPNFQTLATIPVPNCNPTRIKSYSEPHLLQKSSILPLGTQNNKPVEIYENDFIEGERLLFSAFGELVYHNEGYEDVPCYYWVSNTADELRLYRTSTKKLYKKFALSIKSDTKMNLHAPDLSLPYIFVKQ